MNYEDIINGMSEEEIQFLMETEFGPELEKQAAADPARGIAAQRLYAVGDHPHIDAGRSLGGASHAGRQSGTGQYSYRSSGQGRPAL